MSALMPVAVRKSLPILALAIEVLLATATAQTVAPVVPQSAPPQYSFTPIVVPGAFPGETVAQGVNDRGQVAGFFRNDYAGTAYGFVDTGGQFSTIAAPGAINTYPFTINDGEEVAGYFQDGLGSHGFILRDGNFGVIDVPGALATGLMGINDRDQGAGDYTDMAGQLHGFVFSAGTFTTVDYPGAIATLATGINNQGYVVGYYTDGAYVQHGFVRNPAGSFIAVDFLGGTRPYLWAVNDRGQAAGDYYEPNTGIAHGVVYKISDGTFALVDVPDPNCIASCGTTLSGINNLSQLTGWYRDPSEVAHSFLATLDHQPITP